MSFLSPLFLAGALTAAIPIILHLLKRDPEARVRFAAVRLLMRGPVEHTRHRHLRDLLLLALRVAALLLLSIAFARPFVASGSRPPASITVIAIDTSLSLSAPGQLDRARQLAKDAVNRAPAGSPIGVITFAGEARVASAVSGDRALAMSAIDGSTAGFGATRYRNAVNAAVRLLEGRPGTIVIVTDVQASGWDSGDEVAVPAAIHVEVADVGAPPPNLAVIAVHAEGDRLLATIRNAGPQTREARVTLRGDSPAVSSAAAVSIGAVQTADVSFAKPDGRTSVVSVSDPGGIQGDNTRYVVLDRREQPTVLVVTTSGDLARDAFHLQQALAAGGGEVRTYGVGAAQLASWDLARLHTHGVVVLLSTRGLDRHGRDLIGAYVRAGGGLLIAASPDIDGEVVADALGGAGTLTMSTPTGAAANANSRTLAPIDARHPVFAAFGADAAALALVDFRRAATLAGPGCDTIARFTTGDAAMLDCPAGEGRVVALASDLGNRWNDFPLRATFVPFVHEVTRYLSSSGRGRSEYIVGEQPAGVAGAPGLTETVASEGGSGGWVAVNVDPKESDPARLSADEFLSAIARMNDDLTARRPMVPVVNVEKGTQEDRQHAWRYILAFMMALLALESVIAMRTV